MPRIFSFEYFNPLKDEAPNRFLEKPQGIVVKARAILEKRTLEEIYSISDVVSWLLSHEVVINKILSGLEQCADDNYVYQDYDDMFDEAKHLLYCLERVELDFSHNVPNLSWPEIFATHALACIADAYQRDQELKHSPWRDEADVMEIIGADILDAMECICIAESLIRQTNTVQKVKQKVSLQKQNAAYLRHADSNQLKREFIHFYLSGTHKSRADAARRFYDSLPPNRKRILKPTNAVRTLTDGLREFSDTSKVNNPRS